MLRLVNTGLLVVVLCYLIWRPYTELTVVEHHNVDREAKLLAENKLLEAKLVQAAQKHRDLFNESITAISTVKTQAGNRMNTLVASVVAEKKTVANACAVIVKARVNALLLKAESVTVDYRDRIAMGTVVIDGAIQNWSIVFDEKGRVLSVIIGEDTWENPLHG